MNNNSPGDISVDIPGEVYRYLDTNLSDTRVILGSCEEGYRKTLQTGAVIFSTGRSPERENLFLWAGPVFTRSNKIYSGSPDLPVIPVPEDLAGLHFGAITDDIVALDLIRLGYTDILYATDAKTLITALEDGRIDGWAYDGYPARDLISRYARDPAAIRPLYTLKSHGYYYAFNRDTPLPLVQAFQHSLDQIKSEKDENGLSIHDRIVNRYPDAPSPVVFVSGDQREEM
jgi:polar amino acid transport system substrate-binding protein